MQRRRVDHKETRVGRIVIPPPRPLHNLTKAERDRTPPDFADYLVSKVRLEFNAIVVAALWCSSDTYYKHIPGIEVWDLSHNALHYQGPWPIVAHPPCGPWGMLRVLSHETDDHGIAAMDFVHQYGGVVEQPYGSQLFRQYAIRVPLMRSESRTRPGLTPGVPEIEEVFQYDFGHLAQKRTLLYWYKPRKIQGWSRKIR